MTDYVFRCDYCFQPVSTRQAVESFIPQVDLDDEQTLVRIGTYCGPYCGQQHTTWQAYG